MSSTPIEQPGQISAGNDMDKIKSYGGSEENQQSSTMSGGSIAISTVPSNVVNQNPETELKPSQDETSK